MLKALLFDLDGTLANTDELHHLAFADLFAPHGVNLTYSDYATNILGRPNTAIMDRYFPQLSVAEQTAIADWKEATYRDMLPNHALKPLPGLIALLDWADAHGIKTAVVTNAPRASAEAVLPALGIQDRFQTLIIGDECTAPKPDPAPYRAAMSALNVTPAESIAFEDAPSGLRAAKGSGAFVFGMRTSLDEHALRQAGANKTLVDYDDQTLWSHLTELMKEPVQ